MKKAKDSTNGPVKSGLKLAGSKRSFPFTQMRGSNPVLDRLVAALRGANPVLDRLVAALRGANPVLDKLPREIIHPSPVQHPVPVWIGMRM